MDDKDHNGARAILRVPEVLMAIGRERGGRGFSELRDELDFPKSSLHRILRTLEHGGYIARRAGLYVLDYQSARLAQMLEWSNANLEFPASARPVMEWLASLTQESVILSGLSPSMKETIYLSVIASEAPLRGEPVEALIRTCLLEERAGDAAFSYAADAAAYALKWTFHNEAGLVFVAVRVA